MIGVIKREIVPCIVLLGQSNMDGRPLNADFPTFISQSPASTIYNRTTDAVESLQLNVNNNGSNIVGEWGPELILAHYLPLMTGISNLHIVKVAQDSTSIENDWNPRFTGANDLPVIAKNAIRRSQELLSSDNKRMQIIAFVWGQGESDNSSTEQEFSDYLDLMYAWAISLYQDVEYEGLKDFPRIDIKPYDPPFIVMRIGETDYAGTGPYLAASSWTDGLRKVFYSSDDYPRMPGDSIHYGAGGQLYQGYDISRLISGYINHSTPSYTFPPPTGLSESVGASETDLSWTAPDDPFKAYEIRIGANERVILPSSATSYRLGNTADAKRIRVVGRHGERSAEVNF